jgi:glycosyltransferase involved in cell wall biosynthesis
VGSPASYPASAHAARSAPAVDIVVNNYNYGRFLRAAIESALGQAYEHVSVIVVDDGSTDDSREVIASFGDRIVPVLKENGGQASAFNAGLSRSQGDIVVFLDADDLLVPHAADKIAAAFRKEPHLAKAHYRLAVVGEDGHPTGEIKPSPHIPLPAGDLRRAMLRFPFDIARPATSGNAFSAQVLKHIAPIPTGAPIGADWYVVYVSALFGPVAAIDEPLGFYRVHGGNWHARSSSTLDLENVRATITHTRRARVYLEVAAARLGLEWDPRDASMCEVADRAISRKLDPVRHPVDGDTLLHLVAAGARAAVRRFDVGVSMKGSFVGWLICLSLAPRPLARRLAECFVFPERRRRLNRLLAMLRRSR